MRVTLQSLITGVCLSILTLTTQAASDPFAFKDPLAISSDLNDAKYYMGGGLHLSKMDGFCDDTPNDCDDSDTGWQLYGGYKMSKLIVEAQYLTAGDVQNAGLNSRSDVSAFGLLAKKDFKFNDKIKVHARGGMLRWSADNSDGSRSGADITYGLGASYQIKDNMHIRADWQRMMDVETSLSTSSDIDIYGLSLQISLSQ